FTEHTSANLPRLTPYIVAVSVEHIEKVNACWKEPHARLHFDGVLNVKALLQQAEAGLALFVEADDFAVDEGGPAEALAQPLGDVGKLQTLFFVVAAANAESAAVKPRQHAQAVVFRLEDPVGMVKRLGDQGTQHRLGGGRQRRRRADSDVTPGTSPRRWRGRFGWHYFIGGKSYAGMR